MLKYADFDKALMKIKFILLMIPLTASAQEVPKAHNFFTSLIYSPDIPIAGEGAFGIDLGGTVQKNNQYYLGISMDLLFRKNSKDINIPNNLLANETVQTEMKLVSILMTNHFELTPESNIKFFIEGNAGFRFGTIRTEHTGYLLFLKSKDEIYSKNPFGLVLQLIGGFDIPLQKSNKSYLRAKGGLILGTPIKYADINSFEYVNSKFTYVENETATYAFVGIGYIIKIN